MNMTRKNSKTKKVYEFIKMNSHISICLHDVKKALPELSEKNIITALWYLKKHGYVTKTEESGLCPDYHIPHFFYNYGGSTTRAEDREKNIQKENKKREKTTIEALNKQITELESHIERLKSENQNLKNKLVEFVLNA